MAINVPLNAQLQNATQLQQQIQNAVNSVQLNLGGGAGGSRALNSLSQPLGRLTGQADEFTKSLDAANARVLAFGASVGVLNTLAGAFKALVQSTINVEKTLTDINVVFGKSTSEIKNFGKELFTVAKDTGQSFEEVSKAALEFSRQGKTVEETLARTKDALILTRLTGLDTARAVEGLTATINSFSKEALTSSEIINKLAAVDQKFAVSAADLTEALSRSASVAQNAGVGFEELIGIVAALQEKTARGGAVIGNSLKTIFTRVRESDTLKELNRLGVAVEDINTNKLLTASQILKNLAGNAKALGEVQRSDIFKDVGGGFQINQLIALLDDYSSAQSKAAEAQGVATGATNQAYVANEKLNQTIAALINNSVEGLKELGATLGDLGIADSIKTALGVVNGFIENVQGLLEGDGPGAKFAQGIVKGIGSVLSGPGLALFGVIISKLVIDLGRFATQGLKTFLGIGKAASEQRALQEAIVTTLSRNAALQAQIGRFQGDAVSQAAVLAGIYNQQEASLRRQNSIAAGMSSVLYQQGMRADSEGFTQTGRRRRAAGGYLPSAEASDVSRGVGGASPSSQVVSIPNFAFGNGQRGTMVANTSEYIVPNYANGGSAIFNQDMISSMGLPAGAQKIRAAGGYVPNFAKKERERRDPRVDIYWDGKGSRAENESTLSNLIIDADHDIGGIGMLTAGGNERSPEASYNFSISDPDITAASVPALKNSKWGQVRDETTKKIVKEASTITVKNLVGANGLAKFSKSSPEVSRLQFSNELSNFLYAPLIDLTNKIFGQKLALGKAPMFTNEGKDSFISPSVEGAIFQEMISLVSDQFSEKSTALKGEDNRPFDFEAKGSASKEFADSFFGGKPIFKADAKRSDSSYNRGTLLKKMFNDPEVLARLKSTRGDIFTQLPENLDVYQGSNKAQTISKTNLEADDFKNPIKKASKGYIPNFANKALADSINRERVESGLPISAISVTQDNRLMNSRNPTGLAVINSRDEPNGKIPNFANPQPLTDVSFARQASLDLGTSLDDLNRKIKALSVEVSKGTQTEAEAQQALNKFVKDLPNERSPGVTLGQSATEKNIQDVASAQLSDSITPKVAKGFGDAAGKIFLLQSAVSFVTGAFGDLDSATGRYANKIAEVSANITSLYVAGQELATADLPGKLGKAVKGLGLVGLGVGALYEGFKLADFAIKEYTGENEKAATAIAKLQTAAENAAFRLDDLTPEGQKAAQDRGRKALEEGFGSNWLAGVLGDDAAKNPELQKQAALLAAQGLTQEQTKGLIETEIKNIDARRIIASNDKNGEFRPENERFVAGIAKKLELKYIKINESNLAEAINNASQSEVATRSGEGLANIRERVQRGIIAPDADYKDIAVKQFGGNVSKAQLDETKSILEKGAQIAKQKQIAVTADKELALGEKISLDLAKQKVEAILEQKKAAIELSGSLATEGLRLELEGLDVSEKRKNELQTQIKLKEIDNKLALDSVDIIKASIDALASLPTNSVLGVTAEQFKAISASLEGLDITNIQQLEAAIKKIGGKGGFELTEFQLQGIVDLFSNQLTNAEDVAQAQKDSANQTKNFNDRLIDTKNNLQAARLEAERIASSLERAAGVRFSFAEVRFNAAENEIKSLRERAGQTTNTAEKRALEARAIKLEKDLNADRNRNSEDQYKSKREGLASSRNAASDALSVGRIRFNIGQIDQPALDNLTAAFETASGAVIKFDNEQKIASQNFDATNKSLDAQAKAIYNLTSATESYLNTLLQFKEGAGERIAGADIGILSATDPNALASSTIQRQVEMEAQGRDLSDKDYYKLVQTETPIRQKQFELSVETSRVRRTELENEIELMKEIAAISAATDEERLAKIKAIVDKRNEEAQSFGAGFERGVGTLKDKTQKFRSEIGEQIPQLFSDNLAQGLNDAISGAKSLKEALTDAATSFFDAITKRNIENLADTFSDGLASLFPGRKKKSDTEFRAGGGMIRGGSGTKDDVPAMLMGGEYVVKKSAVKKYGSNFLDSLNQGRLSGYATGGAVQSGAGGFYVPGEYGQGSITGQRQLLEFATQSTTSGQFDQMGSYGMSGASINLESESGRLTMAGRENSPIFERTQQTKEEAFQVYLRSLKVDEDYKNQLTEMKEAEKARKKQLIMSIGKAVASAALSAGAEVAKIGAENAIALGNEAAGKSLTGLSKLMTGAGGALQNLGALVPGGRKATLELNDAAKAQRMNNDYKSGVYTPIANREVRGAPTNYGEYVFDSYTGNYVDNTPRGARFASGGPVFGGSGNRDDVPAMLTGGEFVLNNRATKKLGMSNLQRLNSGDTSSQQDPEKGSSDLMQALISKLDELISATTQSSGDNVVVNVSGMDNKGEKNDGQQSANEKDLHRKIKAAVLEVITQEKRLGGSLNK